MATDIRATPLSGDRRDGGGELTFVLVQNPELTVPVTGGFLVDAYVGGGHTRDVICAKTGLGCD
jgi:hypothetical protein